MPPESVVDFWSDPRRGSIGVGPTRFHCGPGFLLTPEYVIPYPITADLRKNGGRVCLNEQTWVSCGERRRRIVVKNSLGLEMLDDSLARLVKGINVGVGLVNDGTEVTVDS